MADRLVRTLGSTRKRIDKSTAKHGPWANKSGPRFATRMSPRSSAKEDEGVPHICALKKFTPEHKQSPEQNPMHNFGWKNMDYVPKLILLVVTLGFLDYASNQTA